MTMGPRADATSPMPSDRSVDEADLRAGTALVTGAGGTVGRAIALALVEDGWKVALVGRTRSTLAEAQSEIGSGRCETFCCDVADAADVDQVRRAVGRWSHLPSVLVNAHGQFGPMDSMLDVDALEWLETFRANFEGTYLMCRAFVPDMIVAGFGRVLNVTSASSLGEPRAAGTAYATSKVAVNQLTRHLAVSLRGTGVTANVFHPGEVRSSMWSHIRAESAARDTPATVKFADWADRVAETGGDPAEKSGRLVVDVIRDPRSINGAFLWIDDPLQPPRPSWEPDYDDRSNSSPETTPPPTAGSRTTEPDSAEA